MTRKFGAVSLLGLAPRDHRAELVLVARFVVRVRKAQVVMLAVVRLLGCGDARRVRVAQRQGQRNQRQAVASERVAELQAKEQARMDEFKKRMGLS